MRAASAASISSAVVRPCVSVAFCFGPLTSIELEIGGQLGDAALRDVRQRDVTIDGKLAGIACLTLGRQFRNDRLLGADPSETGGEGFRAVLVEERLQVGACRCQARDVDPRCSEQVRPDAEGDIVEADRLGGLREGGAPERHPDRADRGPAVAALEREVPQNRRFEPDCGATEQRGSDENGRSAAVQNHERAPWRCRDPRA